MKKILCITLCLSVLFCGGALSIHANTIQPSLLVGEETVAKEILELISVDNMTGKKFLATTTPFAWKSAVAWVVLQKVFGKPFPI